MVAIAVEGPDHAFLGVAVQDVANQLGLLAREDGRFGRAAALANDLLVELGSLKEAAQSTSATPAARTRTRRRVARRTPALTPARLALFEFEQGTLASILSAARGHSEHLAALPLDDLRLTRSTRRVFGDAGLRDVQQVVDLSAEQLGHVPGLEPTSIAELRAAVMLALEVSEVPRPVVLPPSRTRNDLFEGLAQLLEKLPIAERETAVLLTGAKERIHSLQEVAEAISRPSHEVPIIERRALDLLLSQPAIVDACWRLELLCSQYGLGWDDQRVPTVIESLYPGTPVNFTPLVVWLMREKGRLVSEMAGRQFTVPQGVQHFDEMVVATLGRYGDLLPDQLSAQVHAALPSGEKEVFAANSIVERVRILGPAVQRDDGLFHLPDTPVSGVDDRHIRALNGLIGALQKLGSARISALTTEVNRRLPQRYHIDAEYVRTWLTRHPDLFVQSDADRFKLASLDVDILCGLASSWSPGATGPSVAASVAYGSAAADARRYVRISKEIADYLSREGPQPIWRIRSYLYGRTIGSASADKVVATYPDQFHRTRDGIVSLRAGEEEDDIIDVGFPRRERARWSYAATERV